MFPIPGSIIYLTIILNQKLNKLLNNIIKEEKKSKKYLINDNEINLENNSSLKYISNTVKYPVTTNNDIKYFPLGDDAFNIIIDELKKAKNFIFFEYFIVSKGKF